MAIKSHFYSDFFFLVGPPKATKNTFTEEI